MALEDFKNVKPGIGIDIGTHSIKLVEVLPGPDGPQIANYGHQLIPKSISDANNNEEMVAGLLRLLVARFKLHSKKVYLNLSGYNVLVRKSTIPRMPENELVEAIKWDAREELLFPPEEAVVDYYILGETNQEGLDFYELLVVISAEEEIKRLIKIANEAGLQVMGIVPLPLAMEEYDRLWKETEQTEGSTTCYVDLGAERTRVYFITGVEVLFSREIPNSGLNVTKGLVGDYQASVGNSVQTINIDEKRAEEIKLTYGIPAEDTDEETHDRIPVKDFRNRIIPIVTRQVEEIERSIDSFVNSYIMTTVERVVFSGGALALKGYSEFVTDHMESVMDLSVVCYNPLSQMGVVNAESLEEDIESFGPSMVAATGLAVDKANKVNLLPEEYRQSIQKTLQQVARLAPIPVLVILLIALSVYLRSDLSDMRDQLASKNGMLSQMQGQIAAFEIPKAELAKLKLEKQRLEKEKGMLPVGTRTPVDIPQILNEIASRVSGNTALEQVTFSEYESRDDETGGEEKPTGHAFLVKGSIFGSRSNVLQTLEGFLKDLQASSRFVDVKLLDSKMTEKDKYTRRGIDFTIYIAPVLRPKVT